MTDKQKIRNYACELLKDSQNGFGSASYNMLKMVIAYIDSLPEEPVSEDLEEYINELSKQFPEVSFAKLSRIAVRVAKWQEQQNQSTIELAEDHAYFAGRTKTIDEMMEKAIEITFNVSLPSSLYDKLWVKGCKEGDKLLVIKKDEL